MFGPVRLFFALRDHPDLGVLAAVVAVSALFAATPFVIPAVALDYDVTVGRSGLLSAAQVGGFATATFIAGRTLRTHRRYLVGGALAAVALNLLSAVAPTFVALLVLRVFAGAAAGILVWLAWSNAVRTTGALRNVAAAGPLTVFIVTPFLAWVATSSGAGAVYLAIAVLSIPPVFLPAEFAGYRRDRSHVSPSRSNVVLVVALGMATLAGSALFVYGAAIGLSLGLSALVVSLAYSGNALAGLIAARIPADNQPGGVWIFGMAVCAALVAFGGSSWLFIIGIALWGFCFWMATPTLLRSIAAWSLVPDERVGDAQSSMAVGRALGPAIGSVLVADAAYTTVGAFTVAGLVLTGFVVLGVRLYRRDRVPPTLETSSLAD
jgi:predicted MFS family arabinose efflux permease